MKELTEKEALFKAAAYCSASEHCLSEVNGKLKVWGIPTDVAERILKRLVAEKYIDENRYCRFFVNDKFKYNKWGRVKILQALWQKRIPEEISADALSVISEEEYAYVLKKLISAKRKSVKGTLYEQNAKLIRFALGRGFEMKVIRKCLNTEDLDEFAE